MRIPSGESGNASDGILKFNNVLEIWRKSELEFKNELDQNIVGNENEMDIIEKVTIWLEEEIRAGSNLPFRIKLKTSGSILERSKIRPLDEMDFIIQCSLDIELKVSDENATKDWMNSSTLESSSAEKELSKIDSKQPFPHLAKVILAGDYPGLGDVGDILQPEDFSRVIEDFVWGSLSENNLPEGIRVTEGENFLEQTKSGFFLNLEYDENGFRQELTIDLVSVITITREHYEAVLNVMPKYDKNKFKYLTEKNLISMNDGIIVKNGDWRMSFSNSEKKVIGLHQELYRALKYLNKVSEHHIDIPTYYLKEIFCSYLIHQGINKRPLHQPSLAISMAELITFSELHLIGSPFYCTKLGSHLERSCLALFKRFKEKFVEEFEYFSFLHSSSASSNRGYNWTDCIAFSGVIWPQPVGQKRN